MSKEARNQQTWVSPAVLRKMQELAELVSRERFGAEGVPKEITFSEIEKIGHEAGRRLAAQVDHELVAQHRDHFAGRRFSFAPA